jgi:signal transduction histidine kinase
LLTVAAGGAWVARRSLQPITALTEAAAGINASRLDARLPQPPTDDEIGRHVRVLNEMFARLQRGFEQASRFTADASHELRTPLTIIRGELEASLRSGPPGEAQERPLHSLLEQVDHLQKITGPLLLLARFDSGKTPLRCEAIDFSRLVTDGAEDVELLAAPAGITVQCEVEPAVMVKGDAVLLCRIVLNLVDNAIRHNRANGHVRLVLRRDAATGESVLVIANTGSGIPHERQAELFQRFFRLAADRNRESGGTGLGLSLCREIAAAHGGRIALTRGEPDDTEFTVSLPAA